MSAGFVRSAIFLALMVVVFITGCGGSGNPETATVTGVVKHKGTPLANVTVTFQPTGGRPATGVTDASGNYTLSTFGSNDGAVLGDHKVSITSNAEVAMPETAAQAEVQPKAPFPTRYMSVDTSGLTATVKSGSNEVNFELTEQ